MGDLLSLQQGVGWQRQGGPTLEGCLLSGHRYSMTSFRASNRITLFQSFSLRKKLGGGCLSLFVTLLFHLLVDPPLVAERIHDLSVASSPEHVLRSEERR